MLKLKKKKKMKKVGMLISGYYIKRDSELQTNNYLVER